MARLVRLFFLPPKAPCVSCGRPVGPLEGFPYCKEIFTEDRYWDLFQVGRVCGRCMYRQIFGDGEPMPVVTSS